MMLLLATKFVIWMCVFRKISLDEENWIFSSCHLLYVLLYFMYVISAKNEISSIICKLISRRYDQLQLHISAKTMINLNKIFDLFMKQHKSEIFPENIFYLVLFVQIFIILHYHFDVFFKSRDLCKIQILHYKFISLGYKRYDTLEVK